ncbi:MAG: DNA methyltransferase [Chlorobiaceae bacterium]|nr:DNA methyltransferase [Chlorobiaceae bacterium]
MIKEKEHFSLQSTRYQGSKRKLIPWMSTIFKDLEFENVLDVFGGTGVVSYLFKLMGKSVVYNDYLEFNHQIGISLIENQNVRLETKDINHLINNSKLDSGNQGFISSTFKNIYYKENENIWLDNVISKIHNLNSYDSKTLRYKKAIAFNALFQSCLVKRPFNLFHRNNLSIRTRRVQRTFGNKTTWERSFEDLFIRYTKEINDLVIHTKYKCEAICKPVSGLNSNGFDLVYLDPPYLNKDGKNETANYFDIYHFLEGITIYPDWSNNIDKGSKNLKLINYKENIFKKDNIYNVYDLMFDKFKNCIIVLSYKSDGLPSIQFLTNRLKQLGKNVRIKSLDYSYSLKKNNKDKRDREFIIIGV